MDANVWTPIRSVPEDQVTGGHEEVRSRADCVLYMVANPQLKVWTLMDPLLHNERRVTMTRTSPLVCSFCNTVDRVPQ